MTRLEQGLRVGSVCVGMMVVAGLLLLSGGSAQQSPGESQKYMGPRFPSYLKPVKAVAELLPQARALARNKSAPQGFGMGIVQSGQTIALVTTAASDDLALEALRRALDERGVKAILLPEYELVGVTRQDAKALEQAMDRYTAQRVISETAGWTQFTFPNGEAVKKWLKDRRPDLYDQLYPAKAELSPELRQVQLKLRGPEVGKALSAYLDKHPEVSGIFWGRGGGTYNRRYVHPHEAKYMGLFLWDNQWELLSEMSAFPSDVWQLVETQTVDPLAYIDKIRITDPEGTNVEADLTPEQAERFERGVFHRSHLFIWPGQAYGRFGYSVVDYPGYQKDWLSPEPMVLANGVVAATNGHAGFFPRMEIHFKNGYLSEVRGGGLYGELYREFLKSYPKINTATFPFYKHPGYFYLYEVALGTNPKGFRHPYFFLHGSGGHLTPERMRSGVFHWGTGVFVQHAPDAMTLPEEWIQFTRENNLPMDHGFHMHTNFATYEVRLRNANRWVALVDRGHLTSLDNAEVRALASRYGDPNRILAEDWVPGIPGINAPGRYQDYANDPWKFAKPEMDQIQAGTYPNFYPPAKPPAPRRP